MTHPTPTPTDTVLEGLKRRMLAGAAARARLTMLGAATFALPAGYREPLGPDDAPVWSVTYGSGPYMPDGGFVVLGDESDAREAYLAELEREAEAIADAIADAHGGELSETRLSIHRDSHGCFFVAYGVGEGSPEARRVSPFFGDAEGAERFYNLKRAEYDPTDAVALDPNEGLLGAERLELATMPAGYLRAHGRTCGLEDGSLGRYVSLAPLSGDDAREAARAHRAGLDI